jgi:DNA modification methylase
MKDISGVGWRVMFGSCLDRLKDLGDESVDSVVCDPPYELGFMGKSWDSTGIAYNVDVWRECLRVLKPGGHILAFGGSRTWHRLAVAVEDAGFELRDSIAWLYGSGFPKSLDVSKAIDKAAGAERESLHDPNANRRNKVARKFWSSSDPENSAVTAPATDDAKKWQGWGTALKPAFEPVVVGRKPLVGTVAANVLTYGVGGLNIDGTRIGTIGGTHKINPVKDSKTENAYGIGLNGGTVSQLGAGRWPANVMLDEYTAALLDQQSGVSKSQSGTLTITKSDGGWNRQDKGMFDAGRSSTFEGYGDSGGASRFFYVAKASKRDRNEGLDELPEVEAKSTHSGGEDTRGRPIPVNRNIHPTVKPTDLMRQLVRLVTPLGGVVLDPFTGSGSTGKAAILEGFQFIGVELTEEYLPIIQGRIDWAVNQVAVDAAKQDEALF